MAANLNSIESFNSELQDAVVNFSEHHGKMQLMNNHYKKSAFFAPRAGEARLSDSQRRKNNFLKVFANKNIEYTCKLPTIKVPTPGAAPEERQGASIREKILYATHYQCQTSLLQDLFAFDATIKAHAIAETGFNLKTRRAYVKRYDPEFCVWTMTNDNEPRVGAFWAVFSVTSDEAWKRWGVRPTRNPLSDLAKESHLLKHADGQTWFTMAIRWDGETRTAVVGDRFIEEPHKHMMGVIPIDICTPFYDGDRSGKGAFFLDDLIPLQAEMNDIVLRRSMVVRRMSAPVVWGRGLTSGQSIDDIRRNFEKQGGGFVGLKQSGDMGVLQINETKIFQEAKEDVLRDMKYASGFSDGAFGESAGANTSADAIGMTFMPTQTHIDRQNIHWIAFWQSINAKILRAYDMFGMTGEQFSIDGYSPTTTLLTATDEASGQMTQQLQRGGFSATFDRLVIAGKYFNICTPKPITPKNEIEERRAAMDGVTTGFHSRTTAYEMAGYLDPEAEIALLQQEQANPLFNKELTSMILPPKQVENTAAPSPAAPLPPRTKAAQSGEVK